MVATEAATGLARQKDRVQLTIPILAPGRPPKARFRVESKRDQ